MPRSTLLGYRRSFYYPALPIPVIPATRALGKRRTVCHRVIASMGVGTSIGLLGGERVQPVEKVFVFGTGKEERIDADGSLHFHEIHQEVVG